LNPAPVAFVVHAREREFGLNQDHRAHFCPHDDELFIRSALGTFVGL
jgi:hypothetical protein